MSDPVEEALAPELAAHAFVLRFVALLRDYPGIARQLAEVPVLPEGPPEPGAVAPDVSPAVAGAVSLFVASLPLVPDAPASLMELRAFYGALVEVLGQGLVAMQARTEAVLGPAPAVPALTGEPWLAAQDHGWAEP